MPIPHSFRLKDGRSLVRQAFVETGTYLGATFEAARAAGFRDVASVDIRKPGLGVLPDGRNMVVFSGLSPDRLYEMCNPESETLIYLDAHYMGDGSEIDPKYGECPLMAELDQIIAIDWVSPPWIAIDDAPHFLRPWNDDLLTRFDQSQWPTIGQIMDKLPRHTIDIEDGVIYAFPVGGGPGV